MVAFSKGMLALKFAPTKNPPVLNWRCRLTQVDLYKGRKTVVVVVVVQCPFYTENKFPF